MTWNLTLLSVHALSLVALGTLFRHTPDTIQRIVLGLIFCASAIFLYGSAAALLGEWLHWTVTRVAYQVEHVAILLYVFRLFIQDQEKRCLPSSLASFRNLLR